MTNRQRAAPQPATQVPPRKLMPSKAFFRAVSPASIAAFALATIPDQHSYSLEEIQDLAKTSPYVEKMLTRILETGKKPSYPLSAFCMYSQQQRDKLKAENPEIPQTIILEQIRKQWKTVSTKQQYSERAKADYQHYKRLLAYWDSEYKNKEFIAPAKAEERKENRSSLIGKRIFIERIEELSKPSSRPTARVSFILDSPQQESSKCENLKESKDEPVNKGVVEEVEDGDGSESATSSASGESEDCNGGFDIQEPFLPTAPIVTSKPAELGDSELFLKPGRHGMKQPTLETDALNTADTEFKVSSFQTSLFLPVAPYLKPQGDAKHGHSNFHCDTVKPVQRNTVDLHTLLPQVSLFNANKRREKADFKIQQEVIENVSANQRICTEHLLSPSKAQDVDELSACEFEIKHSHTDLEQMDIVPDLATLEECIGPQRACSGLPVWQMEQLELDMHSEHSYKRQRVAGQI